jgi:hypothetical protein
VDWLDRLTFRELGLINNDEKSCSEYMYLMIEFPTVMVDGIPHYVVYFEQNGEEIHSFRAQSDLVTVPDQEILRVCNATIQTKMYATHNTPELQFLFLDFLNIILLFRLWRSTSCITNTSF